MSAKASFYEHRGRPKLSTSYCWVCGELRDWHFEEDEHPFVGSIEEDGAFRAWYQQNRMKHVYFLDWVRTTIGLPPMPNQSGKEKVRRPDECSGLNGIQIHEFVNTGRTPRRAASP